MEFTSENVEDISKYYRNTFVKFKDTGDTLVLIKAVDKYKVTGCLANGDEVVVYLDKDNPFEVDYVLPHKSFFQYGPDACQLCRIPARQYQRGLNSQNTGIARLHVENASSIENIPLSFELLQTFVQKQKFYTLYEAYSSKEKFRTFALGPRMMYHRVNKYVYMDFAPIALLGKTEAGNLNLVMKKAIFYNEMQEFLAQTNNTHLFTLMK